MNEQIFTVTEATRLMHISRQGVYAAIRNKRLGANFSNGRWITTKSAIEEYECKRYSREKSQYNGLLLFDNAAGFYSLKQAAALLHINEQRMYYSARMGKIRYQRKGAAYIFHLNDILSFKEHHLHPQIKTA